MFKPGRNHPCPCGSGLKYKNCCLPRDQAAKRRSLPRESAPLSKEGDQDWIVELNPEIENETDQLLQRLEMGGGTEMAPRFRSLLGRHPNHHLPNYAMGTYLAAVEGDSAAATLEINSARDQLAKARKASRK